MQRDGPDDKRTVPDASIKKPFVFIGLFAVLAGGDLLTMIMYCEEKIVLAQITPEIGLLCGFAAVIIGSVTVFALNKVMYKYNFEALG